MIVGISAKNIFTFIVLVNIFASAHGNRLSEEKEVYEVKAIYHKKLEALEYEGRTYYFVQGEFGGNKPFISFVESGESENAQIDSQSKSDPKFFYVLVVLFFTLFAGAMSGLTVGYLSIDDLVLELKSKTGTDVEQECARKILPILNSRHWLLVTLLLWNATAMEALPIFLNKLVDEFMAIIISVTLVLFFGEIIPQALCTGPSQLQIASFLSPLVNYLMNISFPVSYPIALLLDHLLGKHSKSRFLNTDLKGLIELHTLEALEKLSKEQGHALVKTNGLGLRMEQADLMISALDIKQLKASEIMISLDNVFMLDFDSFLDNFQINQILDKGFSRIPIYHKDKNNILGILRIKQLIGVDISQNKSIRQLGLKLTAPIIVHPGTPALDLLTEFRKGRSHMAFVTPNPEEYKKKFEISEYNLSIKIASARKSPADKIYGMVTLEDVLEKMINIEILDEDDYARTKVLHEKAGTNAKSKFYSKLYRDIV